MLVRNTCAWGKLDRRYLPLIEAVLAIYRALFGADLLNVRLLGSVARGEAIPGTSDIDFLALARRPPRPAELEHLARQELELRRTYPVVEGVDLEAEWLDTLSAFRRFVLSSDSLSLFGVDQLTRRRQYVDRAELARLVTPDWHALIGGYRACVVALDASERERLARYARVIGKDLLRCLRQVALLRGGPYDTSIEAIYEHVSALAPEHRSLAEALYGLYRRPDVDKQVVLRVLDEAAQHLAANCLPPPGVVGRGPSSGRARSSSRRAGGSDGSRCCGGCAG